MPTYEYACKSCGEHLEVSQSFSDPPLTECPICGAPLRKVFGSVGIVLKGSGFYRTDSRAASNGKTAKWDADKAVKSDTEKKGASSSGTNGASPSSSESKTPATTSTSSGSSKAAATA